MGRSRGTDGVVWSVARDRRLCRRVFGRVIVAVTADQAEASFETPAAMLKRLRGQVQPRIRNPHDIADLLSYQLISGATQGNELEGD